MKKIVINSDNRRFNISSIVVGYLEENKEEVLEFEIPEKYSEYGKKACFSANGQTFAKNFDDIISNKLTITRDISQFKELDMTIEFFKIENEDEIVARTSILHILIENAIVCDDDIKPDEPKIIILDNLIDEVTKLDVLVTKNEKKREEYYQEIQKKVDNGDFDGATFTPSVDTEGNISWSNDKNLSNPTTQNIKGEKGEKGEKGDKGDKGDNYIITEADIQEIEDYVVDKTSGQIVSTRNELERVKNDILETGTDTDTFVHLEDSAMAEYQELSVDGVCEQEITTGKNKINIHEFNKNVKGVSIISKNNKITINGTVTESGTEYLSGIISDVFVGIYTMKIFQNSGLTGGNFRLYLSSGDNSISVTNIVPVTKQELNYDIKSIQIFLNKGLVFKNYEMEVMLSEGSDEPNIFEPYTGGQPSPSPNYPQEIKTIENSLKITSCNKNLFDKDNITSGFRLDLTGNLYRENGYNTSDFVRIKSNTQYFRNVTISQMECVCIYNEKKEFIERLQSGKSITTNNEANYIRIVSRDENLDIMQLEKGTQATPYEQHLETQITANLPEGEFIGKISDTYKDTLKVEYNETDGQYHLKLYKRVYKNNSYNGESYNYYISTTARKDGNIECGELQTAQVVYYVGDETIIDLGIVDMPITYNEITNLFTDSDLLQTINAKYYRNFITTIQNLQVNEKALKQELADINTRLSALETAQTSVVSESEVVE